MTTILFIITLLFSTVQAIELPAVPEQEITCLANNIYFEARGQETLGRIAVAKVTMNRVESDKFPNTICKVVKQKNNKVCQFSWYCDGLSDNPKSKQEHDKAVVLATNIWYSTLLTKDPTDGALFYHNDSITGSWFKRKLTKTTTIGNHIFYK